MTRKKVAISGLLALALVATSVVVSGAQATGAHVAKFTCLNGGVRVACTGAGEEVKRHGSEQVAHTYVAGFATVSCANVAFNVTTDADGDSTEAPTEPVYESCLASPGNLTTHVSMNGCEYEFHIETNNTDRTAGEAEWEGSADLECPGTGGSATVNITEGGATRCLVHVQEQTTIKPIRFRNMAGDITVEAVNAAANATFTPVGGGLFLRCGVFSENTVTRYTGNATVRALSDPGGSVITALID